MIWSGFFCLQIKPENYYYNCGESVSNHHIQVLWMSEWCHQKYNVLLNGTGFARSLQDHCNYNWIVFRFRLYCMKFAIFSSLDIHVIMSHNYIMLMNQWYLRISCFLPELHLNTINTDRNTYSMWSPTMSYWKSTLISWV